MTEYDDYEERVPREEKTNWKVDIQRALISPNFAFNDEDYMRRVVNAKDIIALTFPGWDAKKDIDSGTEKIVAKWRAKFKKWFAENEPMKWHKRYRTEKNHQLEMHREILSFLRNYVAKKGMLVEGPRDSRPTPYKISDEK